MLALIIVLLLASVLLVTMLAARALGFSRDDEAALVLCGSQKSLVSGVPIASALLAGSAIGPILLPIILYYPMQVAICAWLARRYANGEEGVVDRLFRAVHGRMQRETAGKGEPVPVAEVRQATGPR